MEGASDDEGTAGHCSATIGTTETTLTARVPRIHCVSEFVTFVRWHIIGNWWSHNRDPTRFAQPPVAKHGTFEDLFPGLAPGLKPKALPGKPKGEEPPECSLDGEGTALHRSMATWTVHLALTARVPCFLAY